MTLVGLSFAYLRDRALNTALNVLLLALAVATMVILILFSAQLGERFERDARGIDLVIGAKGSPLQLILSSIYQVDVPTGNIPMETLDTLRRDFTVAKVIPLAQGDSFRGFRIIGTEPTYPEHYGAELAEGDYWSAPLETVIGAEVARETGAGIGQKFEGSHGLAAGDGQKHDQAPFVVKGILKPTGTVIDRLILTSVESVWDVHGIAHAPTAEGDHAGENRHETRGHHLAQDDHFRERQRDDAHHEGERRPERRALAEKRLDDGNDAGGVGVDRHADQHDRRNRPPRAPAHDRG